MCVVSMVSDHYRDRFINDYPQVYRQVTNIPFSNTSFAQSVSDIVTRKEFDDLKKTVLEMKALLEKAKAYDEATNQHECEMQEKVELVKKFAEMVGVDLGTVFDSHK